jgi:phosphoribosylformylglycinamidine synthase
VSGNVSLYNESKATGGGSAILPTPAIGGVGLMEDWTKAASIALKVSENDVAHQIYLIGAPVIRERLGTHLGQTLWLREIAGREDGPPPPVDLELERRLGEFVRDIISDGIATAVHDISDGGLLVALAEMALAGNVGVDLTWGGLYTSTVSLAGQLFSEDQGRYIVTSLYGDNRIEELAQTKGLQAVPLGLTGEDNIRIGDNFGRVSLADLRAAHEGFFRKLMGASTGAS